MRNAAFLLLVVPVFAGCEELDPFMPKVVFDRFDVKEVDFEHIDSDFVFTVENPNPAEIDLASFDYKLSLEGVELLSGDDPDGLTLEPVGSSELALPVSLIWDKVWETAQATKGEDFVGFGLEGSFGFDTPIGPIELPYDAGGDFPAVRVPKFNFKRLRVAEFDPWNARLNAELDMEVFNDHGSTLTFRNFDWALDLGKGTLASGLIPEIGVVEGGTSKMLVIPLGIDLFNATETLITAVTNKSELDVALDATTDVDTPFGVLGLGVDETGKVQIQ